MNAIVKMFFFIFYAEVFFFIGLLVFITFSSKTLTEKDDEYQKGKKFFTTLILDEEV